MNKTLKTELLRHYAHCKPHRFLQVDANLDVSPLDSVTPGDSDGDSLTSGYVNELRTPGSTVRIQILAGTTQGEAVRVLGKMLELVKGMPASVYGDGPGEL